MIAAFERVTTGIEGLDLVLNGGFLKGGTYLILGAPGTGKTILANQLCFNQTGLGQRAVYVTLLAESHTRMFGNLQPFQFFDNVQIAREVQYMSGYSVLEKEGLDGLLRLLRDLVYHHEANILVIDGLASADILAGSPEQFKKFVHHLNSVLGIAGCTTLLLSSVEGEQSKPEYTMVDGIMNLTFYKQALYTARQIEVRKFRGSSHLYGRHFLEISNGGIAVYPRIEALLAPERVPVPISKDRVDFGLAELDAMLDGGLISGTFTSLLGAAGTGKTQIGMQFLSAGAERGDAGILLSFYESPDRLEEKLKRLGRSMSQAVKNQELVILRPEMSSHLVDKTVDKLLKELRARGSKRLFIEGVNGFRRNMFERERFIDLMTALARELRALGVTTLMTDETASFQPHSGGTLSNESAVTDNIFEFRHAEIDGVRCQTLNIIKTRESRHASSIRLIEFTENGIRLGSHVEYATPYLPVVKRKMM